MSPLVDIMRQPDRIIYSWVLGRDVHHKTQTKSIPDPRSNPRPRDEKQAHNRLFHELWLLIKPLCGSSYASTQHSQIFSPPQSMLVVEKPRVFAFTLLLSETSIHDTRSRSQPGFYGPDEDTHTPTESRERIPRSRGWIRVPETLA